MLSTTVPVDVPVEISPDTHGTAPLQRLTDVEGLQSGILTLGGYRLLALANFARLFLGYIKVDFCSQVLTSEFCEKSFNFEYCNMLASDCIIVYDRTDWWGNITKLTLDAHIYSLCAANDCRSK